MYKGKTKKILDEKGIKPGDLVKANDEKGRLMPKPGKSKTETVILKLESGYNIGVKPVDVELVEKKEDSGKDVDIEVPYSSDKPDILILHTGGTIASRVSYEEGGVKPGFKPEDLVEMYPELTEICNIHSDVTAQMFSEDMEPGHWLKIAEEIKGLEDSYDGIIVGHGTDTLGYTGAALSLLLKNSLETGVLLVGSQRSSDRPSSDAAMNLYSAAKFLTETDYREIGVCMHKDSNDKECIVIPGAKARKMHTSRRNAFKTINTEEIGVVNYQTGEINLKKTLNSEKTSVETGFSMELDTNVGYLKVRPGMKPEEIDFLIEQDYNGVVIEGTGLGHMPVNSFDDKTRHHEEILQKVGRLAEESVVVMTSNCINGRIDMDVYDSGLKLKEKGVIEALDMHPELAYVKLMWSLAQRENTKGVKQVFQKNIAGEITKRSLYKE